MYSVGDRIVYGSAGVYSVSDIKPLSGISCADRGRKYYVLKPVFGEGVVYYPVDGSKIFTRLIISKEQAEKLISIIPSLEEGTAAQGTAQELQEHYRAVLGTHDCTDLLTLLRSIYQKKKLAAEQKKKFGQIDENFMKQAENQLYSELGAALGILKDEVPEYIRRRLEAI